MTLTSGLEAVTISLCLMAMLVWSVLSPGLMPTRMADGGVVLALCSGDGPVMVTVGADGVPVPAKDGKSALGTHDCSFAQTAAPLLAPAASLPLPVALAAPGAIDWPRALAPRSAPRALRPDVRGPPLTL